jgi:predicted SAM-dependent methyltransferase
MKPKQKRIAKKTGIALDVGAGSQRRPGFVTLDKLKLPTIDIVHDLEEFPYPIKDETCITIIASQVIHYIQARFILKVMDELWRIAKPECQLAISLPYGVSDLFIQDPCAVNSWNENTCKYFDQIGRASCRERVYRLV